MDNAAASPGLVSARSAGNALDQSGEADNQIPHDAPAGQETAAADAERDRRGDGSVVDLPVSCPLLLFMHANWLSKGQEGYQRHNIASSVMYHVKWRQGSDTRLSNNPD